MSEGGRCRVQRRQAHVSRMECVESWEKDGSQLSLPVQLGAASALLLMCVSEMRHDG